jgi:hypothetical protein
MDVVLATQKRLSEQLGYPVTLREAGDVAYRLDGTTESRTEDLRQKYATTQPLARLNSSGKPGSQKTD